MHHKGAETWHIDTFFYIFLVSRKMKHIKECIYVSCQCPMATRATFSDLVQQAERTTFDNDLLGIIALQSQQYLKLKHNSNRYNITHKFNRYKNIQKKYKFINHKTYITIVINSKSNQQNSTEKMNRVN